MKKLLMTYHMPKEALKSFEKKLELIYPSEKKIAGAAIDVYEFEPKVGAELTKLEHVALSPHIGTSTYDARIDMTCEALEGMLACLNGVKPHNIVNPSVLA